MINFYVLLGVDNNESSQEIKKAYRKLALEYHPDRHQGDAHEAEEMMKLLNEAKDVLLNNEKRKEYDAEFYSFQQFKSRQQQEAERKKYQQAQQAEREKHEQEKRQQQAQRKHEREETERKEREQVPDPEIERLKREYEQRKAEHLAREAEEYHKQKVLARASKKRNRLILVFIVLVLGIIFYMYQKHQNANKYLDTPYTVYDFDEENAEVPIPLDLYDESVENEAVQNTDNVSASWSEEKVADADQPVLANDHRGIQVNGNQTDSSQPQQAPKTTIQVTESEPPQHVDPIKSKALKSESAHIAPKKQDDSLSISNDDFFK